MSQTSSQDPPRLRLVGPATIAQASDIRDRLATAILHSATLDVEVDASDVDVTLIQLLVAAGRSARERGGRLRLAQAPSGAFKDALQQGGFFNGAGDGGLWNVEVDR